MGEPVQQHHGHTVLGASVDHVEGQRAAGVLGEASIAPSCQRTPLSGRGPVRFTTVCISPPTAEFPGRAHRPRSRGAHSLTGCRLAPRCRIGTGWARRGCARRIGTGHSRSRGRRWARGCGTGCPSGSMSPRCWPPERFVYDDGSAGARGRAYTPHTFVWFHRDLPDEVEVPGQIRVVHRDDRLSWSTSRRSCPRSRGPARPARAWWCGCATSWACRAVAAAPARPGDVRLLMLATERRWRGPYQSLFQAGAVRKTYRALAPMRPTSSCP